MKPNCTAHAFGKPLIMFSVGMAGKLRLLFNLHFSEQVSVMRISGRASVELISRNVGIELMWHWLHGLFFCRYRSK